MKTPNAATAATPRYVEELVSFSDPKNEAATTLNGKQNRKKLKK
jgi:hypothetical protein